jgi:hypothetical protein
MTSTRAGRQTAVRRPIQPASPFPGIDQPHAIAVSVNDEAKPSYFHFMERARDRAIAGLGNVVKQNANVGVDGAVFWDP